MNKYKRLRKLLALVDLFIIFISQKTRNDMEMEKNSYRTWVLTNG